MKIQIFKLKVLLLLTTKPTLESLLRKTIVLLQLLEPVAKLSLLRKLLKTLLLKIPFTVTLAESLLTGWLTLDGRATWSGYVDSVLLSGLGVDL